MYFHLSMYFSVSLETSLLWPISYLEVCCLICKYLQVFLLSFCFLILFHYSQTCTMFYFSTFKFVEVFVHFVFAPFGPGCNGHPLQYSCLENPMDGGAWWAVVHGVVKSQTGLSGFTFTFHFHALEKEMATCSSVLAWRIPGMVEPGRLPSMGSHRVRHN